MNTTQPPPDNQGQHPPLDDREEPATATEVATRLVGAAIALALIDVWLPLNLDAYLASILGAYGGYLLARLGGPQPPPTGLLVR
ncbi:hypothetical protein PV342_40265 [Streptomyces sp. PA03-3a]|nr:hypothetical protein [Streptomyces sp. PA03-3a]